MSKTSWVLYRTDNSFVLTNGKKYSAYKMIWLEFDKIKSFQFKHINTFYYIRMPFVSLSWDFGIK